MLTGTRLRSVVLFSLLYWTLYGCGGSGDDAAPDAPDSAMLPTADAGDDASTAIDLGAVDWAVAPAPAAGPLRVWGFVTARIDAHRAVVFGGTTANQVSGTTLDDTWLYDATGEDLVVTPIEASGPAPRYCACAAWDAARERVVLTGGRDLTAPLSVPAETWELDLASSTWTRVDVPASPPGVIGCMMTWSEARGAVHLFGGAGGAGPSGATYRYDPDVPAWIELDATGPTPRYDGILEPLGDGSELLLFGGAVSATGAAFFSDLWRFDTSAETWTEIVPDGDAPQGRRVPWVTLAPNDAGLYVSMGFDGLVVPIGDFWTFELETNAWTEHPLPVDLGGRAFTHWLPAPGAALGTMLSGYDGDGPVREVWRLSPSL